MSSVSVSSERSTSDWEVIVSSLNGKISCFRVATKIPRRFWSIRQDSIFWSLRQMLYLLRVEKFLAVVHFIYFLRIMQKLSNILHPSRQNWTTEDWFFLQKEVNSIKYLSQLLSHLLLYPGLSQSKLLSSPYIIPPWLFQTHPPTKSGKSKIFLNWTFPLETTWPLFRITGTSSITIRSTDKT